MTDKTAADETTGDDHMGAVEGDTASDKQPGNENASALDEQGLPIDPVAICEDVIGANVDGSEGG
jgi:hypothetical protein